ncbi:helix-turn-helix domain-containing protein [Schaalia odontolytica]|uniref:helix-turn-helix domain-containing protein n=1 Tax=Schaalia odontolytica TaxID=1660 RepID=UPI001D07CC95|nr:helix-turn-helix transcriptional regulator [Schaalia odontolytica]
MGSRSLKTSPFERAVIAVLKERLQNADLTIDRLAERAGITRARCYKIFSGAATCTVTDFCAMCDALGIAGSIVAAEAERRLGEEAAGEASPPRPE